MVTKPTFAPDATTGSPEVIINAVIRRMEAAGYSEDDILDFTAATMDATSHLQILEAAARYVTIVRGET